MKKLGKNLNSAKPPADDCAYKPQYALTEPIVALVAQIADDPASGTISNRLFLTD